MPKPVTVSIDVPLTRRRVYEFLDVMANHEGFNDHLMTDWELRGPDRGIGSKATVHTRALGVADVVDIEVVAAEAGTTIVERNVARKAGRTGEGTYRLADRAGGGTHIEFEYRWVVAPVADRVLAPLVRSVLRRNNATSMRRLAAELARLDQPTDAAG